MPIKINKNQEPSFVIAQMNACCIGEQYQKKYNRENLFCFAYLSSELLLICKNKIQQIDFCVFL